MKKALVDAIYYVNGLDNSYLRYDIVKEIMYDGTQVNFKDAITHLKSDIKVRTLFGNHDNICYQIINSVSMNYQQLLIGELDSLLIVTRHDNAIKIRRSNSSEEDVNVNTDHTHNYDKNIGIIKIDAVLTELNISSLSKKSNWSGYLYWIGIFGLIVWFAKGHLKYPNPYKK